MKKLKKLNIILTMLVITSLLPINSLSANELVDSTNVDTTISTQEQRDYDEFVANDQNLGEYEYTMPQYEDEISTYAYDVVGDWEVVDNGSYYQLKNYIGTETNLVIPGSLNGKQTAIANIDLQKIPQNVTSVTFSEVNGTKVKLLDNVNKILGKAYTNLTNIDLRGLDVTGVEKISGIGYDNPALRTINVTNMDVSNLKSVSQMFAYSDFLEEIIGLDTWDVSNIQDFSGFMESKRREDSATFNFGDVSNWDMRNATSIERFIASKNLENPQDVKQLENWNITSKCLDVTGVFSMGKFTDIDLSKWDTSGVLDTTSLFFSCKNLTDVNVANWNVENVTKTNSTFRYCESLKQIDLSNWYTPNLVEPAYMFSDCPALRLLDMSRFDMTNVEIWNTDGTPNKKRAQMFRRAAKRLPILIVTTDNKLVNEYPYKDDWCIPSGYRAEANGGNFSDGSTLKEETFYTIDHKDVSVLEAKKEEFINNLEEPTRTGYQFDSWLEQTENAKALDFALFEAANATWLAQWNANNYTVVFNGNGATSGAMANQNFVFGTPQTLSPNTFVRDGYTFTGWAISPDQTVTYTDGQEVSDLTTEPNGIVNLYAVWTENSYTLNFDGNGAETGNLHPVVLTYTQDYTISANPFTKTGYKFNGWNTKADGSGITYADEATVSELTAESETTLYAQWSGIEYSVTFDPNGGEGVVTTQNLVYGTPSNLEAFNFTAPAGMQFAGWSTTPNGVVEYTDGQEVLNLTSVDGDNITLYAIYKEVQQPVVEEQPTKEEPKKEVSTGVYNIVISLLAVITLASGLTLFVRRK